MKGFRLVFVAVAAALVLGGCGYRPLYGERAAPGDANVTEQLATVKIAGIADRRGQILRNYLLDRMNPQGEPANPRYVLAVAVGETIAITDSRADGTGTRSDINVRARIALRDATSDVVVYVDRTQAVATFNLLTARLASVSSEDEARRRAMEQLGDQITTLVALFMNRRGTPTAAKP